MGLVKRGDHWFGDSQEDIRKELGRYSQRNGDSAQYFADAVCGCGSRRFWLRLDETEGTAVRTCSSCGVDHPIGDSGEFLGDATLEDCECSCGADSFEITAGVSLYDGSEDVRWMYLGCRCPACGLTACYGDWKNEFEGYCELLSLI